MDNENGSILKYALWFIAGVVLTIVLGGIFILFFGSESTGGSQAGPAIPIRIIQPSSGPDLSALAPIILSGLSAMVAIAAVLASMANTSRTLKSSEREAQAERQRVVNEKELERLETTIATFHTPFLVRSQANKNMAQDLRERFDDPDYRMLVSLLDPKWYDHLSSTDKAIVDEICDTGEKLQTFIETKAGSLDAALAEHLARAVAHFRMLALAHSGKLGHDADVARQYVYPKELDNALNADRERLEARIEKLRADPHGHHGVLEPLELPDDAKLSTWMSENEQSKPKP